MARPPSANAVARIGEQPVWKPELADLVYPRRHLDLAANLTRLAGHYRAHHATLARDTTRYRADDARHAESLVNAILTSLERSDPDPIVDLRARCWTLLAALYGDVRAAAHFLFRHDPHELERFPGLPMVGKRRRGPYSRPKEPRTDSAPSDASDDPISPPEQPESRAERDATATECDPS